MTTYGDGIGQVYTKSVAAEDIGVGRREKRVITIVGGQQVTLIVRDTIVPEDPYLNLVRAAAYPFQIGASAAAKFPVPPVPTALKDVLIKSSITI